ncbi:hypothetical protein ACGGKE_07790 [Sphingobium naphthae]|uniref:hypothetical protein n=1 Tax=Sphingobium naphthae TaxID=1886786 RepID=UPI0037493470
MAEELRAALERLPIRTEILNVDTGERGGQSVEVPLALRNRILAALRASTDAAVMDELKIEEAEMAGMDKAATFCIETLAKALGIDDWQMADGSEEWHGDVAGTIYNVLKAGRVYDDEDGRVARLEDAHPPADAAAVAGEGFYYVIDMPLNAEGLGPATIGKDAVKMTYQVWDQYCDTHGEFDLLSNAIRHAQQLNALSHPAPAEPDDLTAVYMAGRKSMRDEMKAAEPVGLREATQEARNTLHALRMGHRVDLTSSIERIDKALSTLARTDEASTDGGAVVSNHIGPRPDEYHRRELPGDAWVKCQGCPAFRVHDWHYFYCRHLGDQTKPDAWSEGWKRLATPIYKRADLAPCGLPEQEPSQ